VIRAHEAQDAGYRMYRRNDKTGFPSLITLFSAPNYLDSYNNKGAILRYENNVINIRQFNCCPHPYNLPGFMNVFNWSIPFVAEKVGEVLLYILASVDDVQAEEEERELKHEYETKQRKREALRNKIRTVSRLLRLYKSMREERDRLLTTINPKGGNLSLSTTPTTAPIPPLLGSSGVLINPEKSEQSQFEVIKSLDCRFDARPPGIQAVLNAAKMEPSSPEGLRRRQSRDKILSQKKQQEFRTKFPLKIFEAKGKIAPEIKPPENEIIEKKDVLRASDEL